MIKTGSPHLADPGGSVWITDLVSHEIEAVHSLMWKRYGEYLCSLSGKDYRDKVFEYIDKEDSPRPVTYQLNLLKKVGFRRILLCCVWCNQGRLI
jgi:tRNA (cmo5U34)-methyltransferase